MSATQQHMIDAYRALRHGTPPPPPPGRARLTLRDPAADAGADRRTGRGRPERSRRER
ncbi:hypothetical protein [Streptomyces sp. ODS05-4]|uniref:hypothetical protein n=1 Tax=Streptomyces sp. ODS05-4 TaxID=2944939 RepID=UPI00210EA726|nr:hypothetical protein [Streptomyces sp. ODS05-4]